MKTVTLAKPWGKHPAGKTLEVDPLRAATLEKDGFLGKPKAAASDAHPKASKSKGA